VGLSALDMGLGCDSDALGAPGSIGLNVVGMPGISMEGMVCKVFEFGVQLKI
jgi:hypothetical protein